MIRFFALRARRSAVIVTALGHLLGAAILFCALLLVWIVDLAHHSVRKEIASWRSTAKAGDNARRKAAPVNRDKGWSALEAT